MEKRRYHVHLYEGRLNGIENALVILSYPEGSIDERGALKAFISTDVSLSATQVLNMYAERWPIELFFRETKGKLALDKYQIRSRQGIERYWLLMSLAHYMCCTGSGRNCDFISGRERIRHEIKKEETRFLLECGRSGVDLDTALTLIG